MSHDMAVTFMGTTSGGGPSETRNCSSLVVEPLADGSLWMVDCAEGTVRQFVSQTTRPGQPRLRVGRVSKIFITHMHADHTMGILTFLRNVLGAPPLQTNPHVAPPPPNNAPPDVEIFGPRGIRRMIRTLWHITHTRSEYSFVVHELLFTGEQPSVAADLSDEDGTNEVDVRRESECIGKDIWCDEDGFWRGIVSIDSKHQNSGALVDAGPIIHRDPCIGYVIREIPASPLTRIPRKLVILGDTRDPSPIIPLILSDPPFSASLPALSIPGSSTQTRVPVSLLVHEATDAYLPPRVDPEQRTGRNRTPENVLTKTLERGHSTPEMAGTFARRIGAERLVLNHIGARFPMPTPGHHGPQAKFRLACMREIERQAADAWNPGRNPRVHAAWDFFSIVVPPNRRQEPELTGFESSDIAVQTTRNLVEKVDRDNERIMVETELSAAIQSAWPQPANHGGRIDHRHHGHHGHHGHGGHGGHGGHDRGRREFGASPSYYEGPRDGGSSQQGDDHRSKKRKWRGKGRED